jgi:phosphatidylinositol alpha-mannosyltransferase
LIIVGPDGGMLAGAEAFVRREGLTDDVVFTGYVPEEDKPRYYRTADVFCAPNTGNESQGIVLLEAMAAGCPVIASNIEGFAGVITHDVDGILVRPKDSEAIAEALLEVIDDRARLRKIAEMGSARAQFFSWDRVAQRVLSYYERLAFEKGVGTLEAPKVEA